MKPLRVYLDSSDYSVLSDPARQGEMPGLLNQLRKWIATGSITCHFSGAHLSEMAPLDSEYFKVDAAQRRSDVLVDLCGRNALVSLDLLFASEIQWAMGKRTTPPDVYRPNGDWFPDGVGEISPIEPIELLSSMQEAITEMGLSREARRLVQRKTFKNGRLKVSLRSNIALNSRSIDLAEILEKYPMRPQDARILARYATGDASAIDASAAFLESLRDPRWMMQWFRQNHSKLTPFLNWIRQPAKTMENSVDAVAAYLAQLHASPRDLNTNLAIDQISLNKWSAWQDDLLISVTTKIAHEVLKNESCELTAEIIDLRCVGLSTCFRSLHSSIRSLTTKIPRKFKLSDFPDALHASYAPYVDIFRADSFMGPHIKKHIQGSGTIVVSKLASLLSAIESALGSPK